MSIATFNIGIRKNGRLLGDSTLVSLDWDDVEAHVASLEAANPGCVVECEEYEGDYGLDDREYHEAIED